MKYGCDKCNKVFNRLLLADREPPTNTNQPTSQATGEPNRAEQLAATNFRLSLTPKMNKTKKKKE